MKRAADARLFWMVLPMIAPGCRRHLAAAPPLWASAPPVDGGAPAAPPARPEIELGPGLEAIAFAPGRFANAIQKNTSATHALQVIREDATSSFVLDLAADGAATLCRGWRYLSFNDGPEVHTSERLREQLGYRGLWRERAGWVHVDLTLDDSVCPRKGEYSHLVPTHRAAWHLRCLPVTPKGRSLLPAPALVCRSESPQPGFGEEEPHVVPGILPGAWIVLGAGNGLRVRIEARSVEADETPVVRVELSPDPVRADAWERSF